MHVAVQAMTLFVSAAAFAQSCPMCKESLSQGSNELQKGYYLSIIGLVSLPFALGGTVGMIVFKTWWDRTHPDSDLGTPQALLTYLRERRASKQP